MKIEKLEYVLETQYLEYEPIGQQYAAPGSSTLMNKINELIEGLNIINSILERHILAYKGLPVEDLK